ncbi:MAG TPA: hypothetical protein VIG64_09725 [Actinomycetota bacterium]|jgi:hypothetical protein
MKGSATHHQAVLTVVVVALLSGCSGPRQPRASEVPDAVPARSSVDLPRGCGAARIATTITAFLDALNSGRQVRLREHFTPVHEDRPRPKYYTQGFQWFADNGGVDPDGFDTYWPGPGLGAYLDRLQHAGDEQHLAELYVNAYWADIDRASFGILVRRERPGLESNLSLGKGAVRCHDLRIALWNMGFPGDGEDHPPMCAHDETTGDRAAVCTR